MASLMLVVVEPGSHWPEFIWEAEHDIVAWSQASGGLDGVVLQRACARAERSGVAPQLAVIACNADADDESIHRRAFTASRLLRAIAHAVDGGLILSAGKGASAALRTGLLGLAMTLGEALRGSSVSVSVRIGKDIVWPVALAAGRHGSRLGAATTKPSDEMTRRQGKEEVALRALDHLRGASLSLSAGYLDTRWFDCPPKGKTHERKILPS
jgi:hypothetical protein